MTESVLASAKASQRRARELEQELEALLPELGRLVGAERRGGEVKVSGGEVKVSAAIEGCLREFGGCIATMGDGLVVQRYREVHADFEREYRRLRAELERARERVELFSGATTTTANAADDLEDPEAGQPLLDERKHVGGALQGVAGLLAQGLEARAALARQRQALAASDLTVSGLVSHLPSIDDVITAMQQKKTRHNAIIGTTIGCCASFLLWAVLSS